MIRLYFTSVAKNFTLIHKKPESEFAAEAGMDCAKVSTDHNNAPLFNAAFYFSLD
jgi:hypothetical protein